MYALDNWCDLAMECALSASSLDTESQESLRRSYQRAKDRDHAMWKREAERTRQAELVEEIEEEWVRR